MRANNSRLPFSTETSKRFVEGQARLTIATGASMQTFYAMRRANGDWYAVADKSNLQVPIFKSRGDAMTARLRDSGMECFRPVAFDLRALEELRRTDGHTASFLMISDPSRHLKHGLRLSFNDLGPLIVNSTERHIRI
jgi:hypothetical protein